MWAKPTLTFSAFNWAGLKASLGLGLLDTSVQLATASRSESHSSLSHRPTLITKSILLWRIWISSVKNVSLREGLATFCPPRYPLAPRWIGAWHKIGWELFHCRLVGWLNHQHQTTQKQNPYSLLKGCGSSPGAANFFYLNVCFGNHLWCPGLPKAQAETTADQDCIL